MILPQNSVFPPLEKYDLRAQQQRSRLLAAAFTMPTNLRFSAAFFASLIRATVAKDQPETGKKRRIKFTDEEDEIIAQYVKDHWMDGNGGVTYWQRAAKALGDGTPPRVHVLHDVTHFSFS